MRETVDTEHPLNHFSHCHVGIVAQLDRLGNLPALLAPAALARKTAEGALGFFRRAVFEHHAAEEKELFPAVLRSAEPGVEHLRVEDMVNTLTQQHRALERVWERLEPQLQRVAKGQDANLDTDLLEGLVRDYQAHAQYEEREFLPLCETILGRNSNHMAALGLSLHLRHAPYIPAHI